MKNWHTILLTFCFLSCVEEIEFSSADQTVTLVIDCTLSTGSDTQLVKIFRTSKVGQQVFSSVEGATVVLFDQEGQSETAVYAGNGNYRFGEKKVPVIIGGSYYIEIETSNGNKYVSDIETILPVPEIDSLSFSFSIEQIVERENRILERSFFNLSVHTTLPENVTNTFLKWDVEHIFLVSEIQCHPLHLVKSCYVNRPINRNEVYLLDASTLNGGALYSEQVTHQEMDFAFGQAASFYVSQKSLSPFAAKYWSQVEQVVNNTGTIFDIPPAAIRGNLRSLSDPEEQVLGLFSAVDENNELVIITRGDLGTRFSRLPLCGLPGLPPSNIDQNACCSCTSIENSSVTRPDYWPP